MCKCSRSVQSRLLDWVLVRANVDTPQSNCQINFNWKINQVFELTSQLINKGSLLWDWVPPCQNSSYFVCLNSRTKNAATPSLSPKSSHFLPGMDTIESLDSSAFQSYLSKTSNTICGRRPILLLLATVEAHSARHPHAKSSFSFLHYSQSSKCFKRTDSSVSYASGVLTISWCWLDL